VPSFGVHKIGQGECRARTASCIAIGMEVDAAAEHAEGEGYGGLLVGLGFHQEIKHSSWQFRCLCSKVFPERQHCREFCWAYSVDM
jgi:hypothetical protein